MADLTPQAAADDAWLRKRLGARYHGVIAMGADAFVVAVGKQTGKFHWSVGCDAAAALRKARAWVNEQFEQAKGTR
jgi:hypothetical protein